MSVGKLREMVELSRTHSHAQVHRIGFVLAESEVGKADVGIVVVGNG